MDSQKSPPSTSSTISLTSSSNAEHKRKFKMTEQLFSIKKTIETTMNYDVN